MRDTFKKQFQILWDGGILMLLFTVILYVFGLLLFSGIAYFDTDLTSCFPMGTLLACIMAAMYTAISLVGIGGIFNLEISMGCTRYRFFVSYYLVHFVFCIADLCLILLLCRAELVWLALRYPSLPNEIDFFSYLLRWGIPTAAAVILTGGFCGALIMRYGKRAGWTLWVLWMIGCVGIPQIHEAMEDDPGSLLARIGISFQDIIRNIPQALWIPLILLACGGCLVGAYLIVKNEQVKG